MQENESAIPNVEGQLQIDRPTPLVADIEVVTHNRNENVKDAVADLVAGYKVLITDYYSTGLDLLKTLTLYLKKKHTDESFKGQRAFKEEFRNLSYQILVKIKDHKLEVRKAPSIGWFEMFYYDVEEFLLPFTQVQGLNSSWQWYQKGVSIPVLRNKIHPFHGVYCPFRFDHLIPFENWLKRYAGPKKSAIDVGVGSGVLTLQMLKHGFQMIFATDSNPNAIVGLQQSFEGTKNGRKTQLAHGHLFAGFKKPTELIVFNPPWVPASREMDRIDEAIYYPETLFPSFFEEAVSRLLPDGRVVVLFSNLAKITGTTDRHPIEEELKNGERFEKDVLLTKKVRLSSEKTVKKQGWRAEEIVELWVLKLKA